jgi:2-polyprenyl-3-methyl-5-hydroxy-6-metoxy-1,4-benzoquinol methylase
VRFRKRITGSAAGLQREEPMKLGTVADNFLERLALLSGMLRPGTFECWFGIMLARTIMAATKLDVFENLAAGPLTVEEVAKRCGTNPRATEKLLNALVGVGCIQVRGGRYALRRSARSWVLADGKNSFRDQNLMRYQEWRWWEHCEEYARTGKPLRVHQTMTEEEWGVYQRGMRSGLEMPAQWVTRHVPLPRKARQMLDIGGGHGYLSVSICRRHTQLQATILDLPQAIKYAAPLLVQEDVGERVVHRAGNVLTEDLGIAGYDLVFMAAVVHHFDDGTNRELMRRIGRALKPGGIMAIWEPVRQNPAGEIRQVGGLMDLFFGFFSEAGTWSAAEVAVWFQEAGLEAPRPRSPLMMPDLALYVGRKPA